MSVTFAGQTIVADSQGVTHGFPKLLLGKVEEEYHAFSIPGASGIGENFAGDRFREHRIIVEYCTTNFAQLDTALYLLRNQYGTLVVGDPWTSSPITLYNCRLAAIEHGERIAAISRNNGSNSPTAIQKLTTLLTFIQVTP